MAEPGLTLTGPSDTESCGAGLAAVVRAAAPTALVVYLEGELGAGKTTLARGFLRALGHAGRVPSPTYTLVEPYELAGYRVLHVDLYRLRDPLEVIDLDLAGQLGPGTLALIEWPDHGAGQIPAADLRLRLELAGGSRLLEAEASSPVGAALLAAWLGADRAHS